MFQKTAKNVSKTAKSVNSFQSFPSITGTLEKVILQSPKGLSATVLKRVDMVAFRLQTYEVWVEILEIIPSKHCRELLPITSRKVNSSRNCWMTLVDNTDREFWKKQEKNISRVNCTKIQHCWAIELFHHMFSRKTEIRIFANFSIN